MSPRRLRRRFPTFLCEKTHCNASACSPAAMSAALHTCFHVPARRSASEAAIKLWGFRSAQTLAQSADRSRRAATGHMRLHLSLSNARAPPPSPTNHSHHLLTTCTHPSAVRCRAGARRGAATPSAQHTAPSISTSAMASSY
jgi:hypothetical protein